MQSSGDESSSEDNESHSAQGEQSPEQQGGVPLTADTAEQTAISGNVSLPLGGAESTLTTSEQRQAGQDQAEKREMVRRAARRGVVFGFLIPNDLPQTTKPTKAKKRRAKGEADEDDEVPSERRRFCEAVMRGSVVEPSYAKGNWAIRWREE